MRNERTFYMYNDERIPTQWFTRPGAFRTLRHNINMSLDFTNDKQNRFVSGIIIVTATPWICGFPLYDQKCEPKRLVHRTKEGLKSKQIRPGQTILLSQVTRGVAKAFHIKVPSTFSAMVL